MWHGLEGIGWGWIGVVLVHAALFWVLCIYLLIHLMAKGPPAGLSAVDILNARYAKGELTREKFEQMKRDLGEPGA